MSLLVVLALIIFCCNLWSVVEVSLGLCRMRRLQTIIPAPLAATKLPKVSIVVPACNEEATIGPALTTLLEQDYARLEILVVNDRSTDGTGAVLAAMQQQYPQLRLLTINELEPGWLGKSHALQRGAEQATGDILLFTDADIKMAPDVVAKSVAVLQTEHLDHLSLIFESVTRGWLLNCMILDAASSLLALFKPWRVREPHSRYFMGVGAFNMVRRSTYFACGGHQRIPMQPIDDIMLGKLIKQQGFRQECLLGMGMVTVEWYSGVAEMIGGLMKNVFALLHYRIWLSLTAMTVLFLFSILPFWGALLAADGSVRLLFGATVALRLAAFGVGAVVSHKPVAMVAGCLFSPYLTLYILLRSTWITCRDNGISWRGTSYDLNRLRESEPILF